MLCCAHQYLPRENHRHQKDAADTAAAAQAAKDGARYPAFVDVAQRARTFSSSPVYLALPSRPAAKVLADAGLFLPSNSDKPLCYHCGFAVPFALLTAHASPVAVHQRLVLQSGEECCIPRARKRKDLSEYVQDVQD
jgi:hypothetical protein